jgi:Tfp pilus assembly protein PilN
MRAVNLLPRDLERQSGEGGRAPLFIVAGGIAAVTAAAAVLFMSASGSISDQQSQLDSLEAAIAKIPTATGQPAVAPGAIAQERADRVAALSAALTTQVPLDRILRALAYVLPEDAWLTGMTATAPVAAPTGAAPPGTPAAAPTTAQGVTIQGATYSNLSVARVLARLATIPSLENVRLTATAQVEPTTSADSTSKTKAKATKKKQKTVVTFTIDANIAGSGS